MMFKPRSKGGAIKNRLALKDGDHYIGVFRGEPHTFFQHWGNGASSVCTLRSAEGCQMCEGGDRASFRFRVNIVANEAGQWVARVFEGGAKVYDQLVGLSKEYKMDETKVKISRSGSGVQDTFYTILPTKDFQVTPEVLASIANVQLNQLEAADADDSDAA